MGSRDRRVTVEALIADDGQTFAEAAGIRLKDKPAPLFQLLVLSNLLGARIGADIAVAAAREIFSAGMRSPCRLHEATWQQRVDALGRGHYRRYDEGTATRLGEMAALVLDRWKGDLRRLHDKCGDDPEHLAAALCEFPGIGPAAAAIFLREVQAVWKGLQPFVDERVAAGARKHGLPVQAGRLAALTDSPDQFVRLAAACVRTGLAG